MDTSTVSITAVSLEFSDVLTHLTTAKDSIKKAAQMVFQHPGTFPALFAVLKGKFLACKSSSSSQTNRYNAALLYVLDSVCQTATAKQMDICTTVIQPSLLEMVLSVVPADGSAGEHAAEALRKVCLVWRQREIFSDELLSQIEAHQAIAMNAASEATPERPRSDFQDTKSALQFLEETRQVQKRARYEERLRPANEDTFAEFNEMWEQTEEKPTPHVEEKKTVYLIDLDETLVVFNSLLDGAYAQTFNKNPQTAKQLGERVETMLFELLDRHMFYKDLQDFDQPHITTLSQHADAATHAYDELASQRMIGRNNLAHPARLADRYAHIASIYTNPLPIDASVINEVNAFTDGWIDASQRLLSRINGVICIVSADQLTASLAKLMAFGLADKVLVENVWSAKEKGKMWCFNQIMSKYGHNYSFIVIGDGKEESDIARQLGLEFHAVSSSKNLDVIG